MQKYITPQVRAIPPSGIRAFFDLVSHNKEVISLGVGEPDFVTPWHVRDVAVQGLEQGKTTYTPNAGLVELREEIASYMHAQFGLVYEPQEEVLVTVGGSEAIDLALRVLVQPGDEVLVPEPTYVSYAPVTAVCGGVPVGVPTYAHDAFKLRPEALRAAITPRSKVLILSYPSNPTGAIMTKPEWEAIAQLVKAHDLIVISDEIYAELTYSGKHVSFASLPEMRDRTIVVSGFSKAFAMTGWRLGYACGHRELLAAMLKVHQYTIMCAPTMSQWAAVEALRYGMDEVAHMVESYNQRRRLVVHTLRQMGIDCHEPQGAFYVFPYIGSLGVTSAQFAMKLLTEGNVAAIPGHVFGQGGEGFIRCSYATSVAKLTEALTRMAHVVAHVRQTSTPSAVTSTRPSKI